MSGKMPPNHPENKDNKAIRNQYSDHGVKQYYQLHGHEYSNPHFLQIEKLLQNNQHRIDYSNPFDLCCGSGEVTSVLLALGVENVTASDPFTQQAFQQNIGQPCLNYTFMDIVQGKFEGQWSSVICSFAMHLCPSEQLYMLAYNLFQTTNQLIIITPHKRPKLEQYENVSLQFKDFSLTPKGKKVWLKSYIYGQRC